MKNLDIIGVCLMILGHLLLITSTESIVDPARNFLIVLSCISYVVGVLLMYVNFKELKK